MEDVRQPRARPGPAPAGPHRGLAPAANAGERDALRRARRLEYLTLGYNLLEALASLAAGIAAGSTALVGFGADSLIESTSGAALLWRLQDRAGHDDRERRALKLVGASFLLLAGYVAYESAASLLRRDPPEASWAGVAIALLSLVVMPWVARKKRHAAAQIGSRALHADARQTSLCAYLSAILLGGLALNALAGWWWADPVAALVMVPIIAHEGIEALRGERCEDCVG
jgi:divalent metal cation (Fe/Co/Zn/Cd) transporter